MDLILKAGLRKDILKEIIFLIHGLQMFYTSDLDNVFFADDIECFIAFDIDESNVLKSVLCEKKVKLIDVLQRIDIGNRKCRLGFTPHA